jgi:acyl-[acyl-carrier-protein]-phospholipid O-acyltransferase/long-chain-fatty-acid--[acyl-carrier-protein] ligase
MTKPQQHPLRGLIVAQIFGAFNDNAFKLFVALLSIRAVRAATGGDGPAFEAASQTRTTLAFVVFTLPLVLFSLPAGYLADRASKRSVLLGMKGMELALMTAGAMALFVSPTGVALPLVLLGLMGVQTAFFSPAKYGILPEILPHDRLSAGNGLLETWTFIGIIAGTATGGPLLDATGRSAWIAGLVLTSLAAAGLVAARTIPRVPPARPEGGFAGTLRDAWRSIRADRVLFIAVLGSAWFWGVASLLGQDVLV